MAKLSGWTYLIIGVLISSISYIINQSTDDMKLFLFFIIGVVFIVIGFFKIVFKKKPKVKPKHPKIVFCPFCGQAVYETQKQCHRCRSMLK